MGLAPADIARLTHLKNAKIVFSIKRPSPSAGTTTTLNLPCFTYKGNLPFLIKHSLSNME
jgi:hypothetical protein